MYETSRSIQCMQVYVYNVWNFLGIYNVYIIQCMKLPRSIQCMQVYVYNVWNFLGASNVYNLMYTIYGT